MFSSSFESRKIYLSKSILTILNLNKEKGNEGLEYFLNLESKNYNLIENTFLKKGLYLLTQTSSIEHLEFALKLEKISYEKNPKISSEDLQLITICQEVIPHIKTFNLLYIDNIFNYILSLKDYVTFQNSLKKIDPKYNLTKKDIFFNIYTLLSNNVTNLILTNNNFETDELKFKYGISEYDFINNYKFDGYTFDYVAITDKEKLLIDIINPGSFVDIDKLRNKINYIKEEISIGAYTTSFMLGISYDEFNLIEKPYDKFENITYLSNNHNIIPKTTSSIENVLSIVKSCNGTFQNDVTSKLIMVVDNKGISFIQEN